MLAFLTVKNKILVTSPEKRQKRNFWPDELPGADISNRERSRFPHQNGDVRGAVCHLGAHCLGSLQRQK